MPIYEYVCPSCNSEFETIVKNSKEKVNCPKCSTKAQRILSAGAFRAGGALSAPPLKGGKSACLSCSASSCAGCGLAK